MRFKTIKLPVHKDRTAGSDNTDPHCGSPRMETIMLAATVAPAKPERSAREASVIDGDDFHKLLDALQRRGFTVIGPTRRDGAILYAEIEGVADLPTGWTARQEAGEYRLEKRCDQAYFGYTVGPTSWKQYLCPPLQRLWAARKTDDGFEISGEGTETPKYAFLGVRACDLHAIRIQDKIYLQGPFVDQEYTARRSNALIIAVNCTAPSATCFCASMGTGPQVHEGYDLVLTELAGEEHRFVAGVGSMRGAEILADVPHRPAGPEDLDLAQQAVDDAGTMISRHITTDGLRDRLYQNLDHPHWDDVAERCLTCGNCTLVCPTCFCMTVEDTTDLTGQTAERWRHADSCFTAAFSYVSGGSVRASTKSRYRQWLTHKLATWVDQFGEYGCVGCGRCITWCPVGIDLTHEVAMLTDEKENHGAHE